MSPLKDDDHMARMARKMEALCATFPALRSAPGIKPWDPDRLDAWSLVCSTGERSAVQFVLHVWALRHEWRCGPFTLRSLYYWDDENLQAFVSWAQAPWFV